MTKQLAMHEKLEVHEVLTFKTACVAKNKAFLGLVQDEKLKSLLEEDIELSARAIKDMKKLLKNADK